MSAAPVELEAPVIVCACCGEPLRAQFQPRLHQRLPDMWQVECTNKNCDEWMMTRYQTANNEQEG